MQITEACQVHNLQGRLAGSNKVGTSNSSPVCWQNSFLFGEKSHFLLKPSSDWMRPSNTMEGNLFCSKFSDFNINLSSVQSLSRVQLCDPMVCSTPGLPVHYQFPELAQTHVHRISDALQPSHPLSSLSLPAFNLSQDLFQ